MGKGQKKGRVGAGERASYLIPACELGAKACWVHKALTGPDLESLPTLRAPLGLPRPPTQPSVLPRGESPRLKLERARVSGLTV